MNLNRSLYISDTSLIEWDFKSKTRVFHLHHDITIYDEVAEICIDLSIGFRPYIGKS